MSRLIDELRSELFSGAHPILQAAYAHYAFVAIHPFPDGNGRVSRALASVYLYRNPGVPLVIFADQSADYLNALEEADNGRPTSFVQFICERVADTVALVRAQMQVGIQPGIDGQMRSMQKELVGRGGLQHLEVDALADRLLSVFKDALTKMTTENPLMAPLSVQVHPVGLPMETAPGGYRFTSNQLGWSLTVSSAAPANASRPRPYRILVAQTGTETADFLIRSQDRTVMEVLLREVHPVLTTELVHRAEMIALAEYQSLVAEVRQFAAASLRQNGYQ
jgi:hypothetical protein